MNKPSEAINSEKMERAQFSRMPPTSLWPNGFWLNRDARIAFDNEGVEDADSCWLEGALSEKVRPGKFVFYRAYGTDVNALSFELIERLGLPRLRLEIRRIAPAT